MGRAVGEQIAKESPEKECEERRGGREGRRRNKNLEKSKGKHPDRRRQGRRRWMGKRERNTAAWYGIRMETLYCTFEEESQMKCMLRYACFDFFQENLWDGEESVKWMRPKEQRDNRAHFTKVKSLGYDQFSPFHKEVTFNINHRNWS